MPFDALVQLWDDNGVLVQPGHAPVISKSAFVEFQEISAGDVAPV